MSILIKSEISIFEDGVITYFLFYCNYGVKISKFIISVILHRIITAESLEVTTQTIMIL